MGKRKFGVTWGRMNYYSRVKELIQERERELVAQECKQAQLRLLGIINGLLVGVEHSLGGFTNITRSISKGGIDCGRRRGNHDVDICVRVRSPWDVHYDYVPLKAPCQ